MVQKAIIIFAIALRSRSRVEVSDGYKESGECLPSVGFGPNAFERSQPVWRSASLWKELVLASICAVRTKVNPCFRPVIERVVEVEPSGCRGDANIFSLCPEQIGNKLIDSGLLLPINF